MLINNAVLPKAAAFTIGLIVFQAAVAMILTRGDLVATGLLAGASFAALAALASSPGGTAGNLLLAAIQIALVLAR